MKKRTIFLASLFFLTSFFASAEKIIFPVNEEDTGYDQPVDIPIDWNEKWFGAAPSTEYNHNIARIACLLSEVSYVNLAVDPELNQLKNVYSKLGIKSEKMEFHYDLDYSAAGVGKNQAAFSFASKEIDSSTGKKTLVILTVRGTPHQASEWISNINVSDSERKETKIHEGFFFAENVIHNQFIYYLLKNKIDPDNAFFLITGHSRGAAISNILGADLADEGYFNTDNIYVYTFAAPNVSAEEKTSDPKYNFIWNIVNPEDIVPTVPLNRNKWKYQKFGQTKVFANYWNTEKEIFNNQYIPKINSIFSQLMRRDYCPFKLDSYIPSLITRLITDIYPTVKDYYGQTFGLRGVAEKLFTKLFPTEESDIKKKDGESGTSKVQNYINKKTSGLLEYSGNAFFDMHVCSNYLSWMLSLSEEEAFNDSPSSRIIIQGAYECAIFDKDNNVVARILDGIPVIKSLKIPVVAVPYPSGTIIGFPSVGEYKVVIYKDSILPTPVPLKIEHYDSQGYLTKINPKQTFFTHTFKAYYFNVGHNTLSQTKIIPQKIKTKEIRKLVKYAKLKQEQKFRILPEFSLDTDLNFEGGLRIGSRAFHGTILASQDVTKLGKSIDAKCGLGIERNLIGQVLLGIDAFGKIIYAFEEIENDEEKLEQRFNFVPEARFSLGFKPFHRATLFISGVFDFHIDNFNNGAFNSDFREKNFGSFSVSEDVEVIPSLRFGFRF